MITPSYALTATERVLPKLALDFTTAILDPRITFTRSGNTATVINNAGTIVGINADLPRFDFNPTTLVCKGLLIEEARTNALLNSLIDGTSLATQSVTVTAAARTLSFYGAGTVVLSGAHSATVVGTGAYPARRTLTFTPSAGSLTLTVTGSVQYAQLEIGSFATSFIPTAGLEVTRNADIASMTGTNFSDWFNATEGTFVVKGFAADPNVSPRYAGISDGTNTNRFALMTNAATLVQCLVTVLGSTQANILPTTINTRTPTKFSFKYKINNFAASVAGGNPVTDTSGLVPTVTTMYLGANDNGTATNMLNGCLEQISYYNLGLTSAEVQSFSK